MSPSNDWRGVTNHLLLKRYNQAAFGTATVTNTLYYRLYTPSSFGAPFAFGESWTYTEQISSSNSLGNKVTDGITAVVAPATESVTVPAGTFTCYNITITQLVGTGSTAAYKTITEYWDASGGFPYSPVKIVDSVNFAVTQTNVLNSFTN
jgi:hypothetical protein